MAEPVPVTVAQVAEALGLTARVEANLDTPVSGGQVSDLLSHVMACGKRGQVWITIQTHANIVAVAALAGMAAIIIAGGFQPEEETLFRAEEEEIALYVSDQPAYLLAGKLYELGVR